MEGGNGLGVGNNLDSTDSGEFLTDEWFAEVFNLDHPGDVWEVEPNVTIVQD